MCDMYFVGSKVRVNSFCCAAEVIVARVEYALNNLMDNLEITKIATFTATNAWMIQPNMDARDLCKTVLSASPTAKGIRQKTRIDRENE